MKNVVQDVIVRNKFSIESDHRAVRARISINTRKETLKLIRKTGCRKLLTQNADYYAQLLNSCPTKTLTNEENIDVEETNSQITTAMKDAESKL